jgi:hypothetical protein
MGTENGSLIVGGQVIYDRLEILYIFWGRNKPDRNQKLLILLCFDEFINTVAYLQ